jgi:hypothetical protein
MSATLKSHAEDTVIAQSWTANVMVFYLAIQYLKNWSAHVVNQIYSTDTKTRKKKEKKKN